jgi:hypothetical protein
MTQYKRIAIDTSKAVFTLHGIDQQDRPVLVSVRELSESLESVRTGGLNPLTLL